MTYRVVRIAILVMAVGLLPLIMFAGTGDEPRVFEGSWACSSVLRRGQTKGITEYPQQLRLGSQIDLSPLVIDYDLEPRP